MNKEAWLKSSEVVGMIAEVWDGTETHGKRCGVSRRKLLLFAVACCRNSRVTKSDDRQEWGWAINALEDHAEGKPCDMQLVNKYFNPEWEVDVTARQAAQGVESAPDILRGIVGNPFPPVTLPKGHNPNAACRSFCEPGQCPWITPQVLSLTNAAYEERLGNKTLDPDRLAILADALEEAGCPSEVDCAKCLGKKHIKTIDNAPHHERWERCDVVHGKKGCNGSGKVPNPIIARLRGSGPFYRGDWVLDLILGNG